MPENKMETLEMTENSINLKMIDWQLKISKL